MTSNVGTDKGTLYGVAMLISGTFSTVIMKTEYGVRAEGTTLCVDPQDPSKTTTLCPFDKPWFGVLQMKLAMALCLVFLFVRKATQHKSYLETPLLRTQKGGKRYISTPEAKSIRSKHYQKDESTSLLHEDGAAHDETRLPLKTVLAVALPSMLDLLQTVGANVGLLWISSSVYQMARGSVIIFSALFSVQLMGKRLYGYHYASILIVAISVVLVGWAGTAASSSATSSTDSSHAIFGLVLVVLTQMLTALQIVVEEHMMVALNVSPMLLVGLEGVWGLVFYIVLIPVLTLTPSTSTSAFAKIWHEDFYDSLVKISNSWTLVLLILAYIVAVGTLNVTANYVTKHLSAVMRSIAETLRTLGVWMLGLFVFYVVQWRGGNSPGEEWTAASWIELSGFVLMVYGTLAYKQLLRIPVRALYAAEARDHAAAAYKSPFMSGMHK